MNTSYKITNIPTKYLAALSLVAAKKDVRYYLNGIHLTKRHIEATDGVRLIRIELETAAENLPDSGIIIPIEAVKTLLAQLTQKQKKQTSVDITFNGDLFQMQVLDKYAAFYQVDGKFPDADRAIPKAAAIEQTGANICFNWLFMADMQKAGDIIAGKKNAQVVLLPNDNSAALVQFVGFDYVIGVLMPKHAY